MSEFQIRLTALKAAISAAITRTREEDAKAVCEVCDNKYPTFNTKPERDPQGQWLHIAYDELGSLVCQASKIWEKNDGK